MNLKDIKSFGDVAAEDDDVLLDYFVSTNAVKAIGSWPKGYRKNGSFQVFHGARKRRGPRPKSSWLPLGGSF